MSYSCAYLWKHVSCVVCYRSCHNILLLNDAIINSELALFMIFSILVTQMGHLLKKSQPIGASPVAVM